MKRIMFTVVAVVLLVGLAFPIPVIAKTKWDLEGWRDAQGKWMDGLLWTYYEDEWVFYRLNVTDYNGADYIAIQHDYLDADGDYGIDGARNFFIGSQTDRPTPPESITHLFDAGPGDGVFHVDGPYEIPVPNGSMLEYRFIVDDFEVLTLLGDFAFYWEAHCSLTNSTGVTWGETIEFGSSFWSGASLHAHTSVTGNQDVPIKTPPQVANPSIDVEKYVGTGCCSPASWYDADDPTGPVVNVCNNVWFKFVVTNTGDVTLTNITLSDSNPDYDVSGISITDPLPAGGSFEGVIGPFPAAPGQQTNTATVTGYYGGDTYQDTDDANYKGEEPAPCG